MPGQQYFTARQDLHLASRKVGAPQYLPAELAPFPSRYEKRSTLPNFFLAVARDRGLIDQHRGVRGGAQHHTAHLAAACGPEARRAALGHGHPRAQFGVQAALQRPGVRRRGLGGRCAGARTLQVRRSPSVVALLWLPDPISGSFPGIFPVVGFGRGGALARSSAKVRARIELVFFSSSVFCLFQNRFERSRVICCPPDRRDQNNTTTALTSCFALLHDMIVPPGTSRISSCSCLRGPTPRLTPSPTCRGITSSRSKSPPTMVGVGCAGA